MRLEQRAWVSVAQVSGLPEPNKQFVVQTTAVNSGRTFAKQFKMITIVQARAAGTEPSFDSEEGRAYDSLSLMPPNGVYTTKNTVTGDGSVPFIPNPTQADIDRIKAGQAEIFVFGKLDYDDIFRRHHWVIFCSKLNSDLAWVSCKEHNDADNNDVNPTSAPVVIPLKPIDRSTEFSSPTGGGPCEAPRPN